MKAAMTMRLRGIRKTLRIAPFCASGTYLVCAIPFKIISQEKVENRDLVQPWWLVVMGMETLPAPYRGTSVIRKCTRPTTTLGP